jgi:hypothetical protein
MKRKERRHYTREATHIPAYIIAGREVYPCTIKNLSEVGFFVETVAVIIPGTDISMVYQSSEDKKETKTCKSVRISDLGIGGKFNTVEN